MKVGVAFSSSADLLLDTFLKFFDSGKLAFATATSIRFSSEWCVCCSAPSVGY